MSVSFPYQLIKNAKECSFYWVEGLAQSVEGSGKCYRLYIRLKI